MVGFLPQIKKESICIPVYVNDMQIRVITYLLRKFQLLHFGFKSSRDAKGNVYQQSRLLDFF